MMNRSAKDGPMSIMLQSSGILHNWEQSEKCVLSEMTCANYASGKILCNVQRNPFHHSAPSPRAGRQQEWNLEWDVGRQKAPVFPVRTKTCEAVKHAHGDLLTPAFPCSYPRRSFDLRPVTTRPVPGLLFL